MPLTICSLPSTSYTPPTSSASQQRAAGIPSQQFATSRTFRYARRPGEVPSRLFPTAGRAAAAATTATAKKQLASTPLRPSPTKTVHAPVERNKSSQYSRPSASSHTRGLTSVDRQFQESLRSYSSPVEPQARPKVALRSTPAQQTGAGTLSRTKSTQKIDARILYSKESAQRDLKTLTESARKLKASIQFNQKRLPEAQIENMKDLGKAINALMRAIKTTDSRAKETSTFRRDTNMLKGQVESHLTEISTSYIRETPPRPDERKPRPKTDVAIDREGRHANWKDQFTVHQQGQRELLKDGDKTQHPYVDWRVNFPVEGATPKAAAETAQEIVAATVEETMQEAVAETTEETVEEKTNESTLKGDRTLLADLGEYIELNELLEEAEQKPQLKNDQAKHANQTDQDPGYISQGSSENSSPPISPAFKKQVSSPGEQSHQKEQPTKRHIGKDRTSSHFRSLPSRNLNSEGVFRPPVRGALEHLASSAGGTKEV